MLRHTSADSRRIVTIPEGERVSVKVDIGDLPVQMLREVEDGKKVVSSLVSPKFGAFDLHALVTNGRSKYIPRRGEPSLILLRRDVDFLTVAHEIAHDIEFRFPRIAKAAREFLMKRKAEGDTVPLSKITKEPKDTDMVHLDKWEERGGTPYTGRDYPNGFTEILTTGIERLHLDAVKFYEQDPEFFEFVVTTLHRW